MRKSVEGLANQVQFVLWRSPWTGHGYGFTKRRKPLMKMLVWAGGGFTIVYKRLERGCFAFPEQIASASSASVQIDMRELSMLLEGVDLKRGRVHKRWEPKRPLH